MLALELDLKRFAALWTGVCPYFCWPLGFFFGRIPIFERTISPVQKTCGGHSWLDRAAGGHFFQEPGGGRVKCIQPTKQCLWAIMPFSWSIALICSLTLWSCHRDIFVKHRERGAAEKTKTLRAKGKPKPPPRQNKVVRAARRIKRDRVQIVGSLAHAKKQKCFQPHARKCSLRASTFKAM